MKLRVGRPRIENIDNYYLLPNRRELVARRSQRLKSSREKIKKLAGIKNIFNSDKSILMVGITGSLAMLSASEKSDIDLMLITKKGMLWSSRLKNLLMFKKKGIPLRRANDKLEKDKLCLNIWMDEANLKLEQTRRNPYTAHEIAQIIPLVNKQNTFERLIYENAWVREYWPNAVVSSKQQVQSKANKKFEPLGASIEGLARGVQYLYMKPKHSIETIEKGRAFFHPRDFSKIIKSELANRGVVYD